VPLKGDDIQALRFEWVRQVVNNPARIRNSHAVVERHFDEVRAIEFYRNLFDNRDFDQAKLDRMLASASYEPRQARTADASIAAAI